MKIFLRVSLLGLFVGMAVAGCADSDSQGNAADAATGVGGTLGTSDAGQGGVGGSSTGGGGSPGTGGSVVTGKTELTATIDGTEYTFSASTAVQSRPGPPTAPVVYTALAGQGTKGTLTVTFPGDAPGTFTKPGSQHAELQFAENVTLKGGNATSATITVTDVGKVAGDLIKGTFSGQVKTFVITNGRFSVTRP